MAAKSEPPPFCLACGFHHHHTTPHRGRLRRAVARLLRRR